MNVFEQAKRIVIKVGTSTLTYPTGLANIRRMEKLVSVLSDLANQGKEVVLVTSGALSIGCGKMGVWDRPKDTPTRQALAAVGQCELMYLYDNLFTEYRHNVAQVLLTKDIVDDDLRRQNVINTFSRLLELRAIPIVNENDTVAVDELEWENFGDNDTLSAIVASLIQADVLVIVSDVDGLYTANPRDDASARLIPVVESIDDYILSTASGSGSARGTGGMVTKMQAATIATGAGVHMAIISGESPALLYDLFDGKPVGTHFVAKERTL